MQEKAKLLIVWADLPMQLGSDMAFAHVYARGAVLRSGAMTVESSSDFYYEGVPQNKPREIPLENFSLSAQVDDRRAEPYALRYGYKPTDTGMEEIITARDMEEYARPLQRIEAKLREFDENVGPASTFGHLILRLARILHVDYVVIMPSRPWSGTTEPRSRIDLGNFASSVVASVNNVVAEAHNICASKVRPT